MSEEKKERVVANEIEIDADVDAVWRALTEGEHLSRWFSPDAQVTPGEGGAIWMSWGEGMEWEAPIALWEPKKQLRTVDPPPGKAAIDYYIEGRGDTTVMRIVQSGFAADAWEEEIDTLNNGWRAFLANLQLYLGRHAGKPRTLAYFRHPIVQQSREEVFPKMLRVFGIPVPVPEGKIDAVAQTGDRFELVPKVVGWPINFSAVVKNMNDAFLMIEIEPGRGQCRPAFWLSLYGDAGAEAEAIGARLTEAVKQAF